MSLQIQSFHHAPTGSWSYLVSDNTTHEAAIIDPVLGYDAETGCTDTAFAQGILDAAFHDHLDVRWLLETHAHADHLSAAHWLKSQRPHATVAVGREIRSVQRTLAPTLGLHDLACDGSQFDRLLDDGDLFRIGTLLVRVIATPGHTRDALTYQIGHAVFVGDTVFLPDSGTARCDFPGGDAGQLFRSIQRLYALPPQTRVYVGHDYGPGGRERQCATTIAELRGANIHVRDGVDEAAFVAMRQARDATLAPPALMEPALRANLQGGAALAPPAPGPSRGHPFARYMR